MQHRKLHCSYSSLCVLCDLCGNPFNDRFIKMLIIRPVRKSDEEKFFDLISDSTLGITNLPKNREALHRQIVRSEASFEKEVQKPHDEEYRFILEELTTGKVAGTSGILAKVGSNESYLFKRETLNTSCALEAVPASMDILRIIQAEPDTSEICALYLKPDYRHSGIGRLLSLSRFLFMAAFPQRVNKRIMAMMRAYVTKDQLFPFWEGVGKHFCHLTFTELMEYVEKHPYIIPKIIPQYPLYVDLLPKEVQESIGRCHDLTKPALNMLKHEGFSYMGEMDIFDGGPALTINRADIRTIKTSARITLKIDPTYSQESSELFLISNEKIDFRACFGSIHFESPSVGIVSYETAEALCLKSGDVIRYARMK